MSRFIYEKEMNLLYEKFLMKMLQQFPYNLLKDFMPEFYSPNPHILG